MRVYYGLPFALVRVHKKMNMGLIYKPYKSISLSPHCVQPLPLQSLRIEYKMNDCVPLLLVSCHVYTSYLYLPIYICCEPSIRVSPYRLAAHLGIAATLFGGLIWTSMSLLRPPSSLHLTAASCGAALAARKRAPFFFAVLPVSFMSGAFVAGNDAGRTNNTWPKMADG